MAIQHEVAGPVIVTWNTIQLGYSRDGVPIRIEPKWIDIQSDDYGGAAGAPSDIQLAGALCIVTAELTKYSKADCHALTSFYKGGSAGVLPVIGSLIRQNSYHAALLLDGVNEDWTFSTAVIRQAIEVNKGTRYSTLVCGWECWINNTTARTLFTIA